MIEDTKPQGWDERFRNFAKNTRELSCYTQGMWNGRVAIWLSLDGLTTMLAFGEPAQAKEEATRRLQYLIEKMQHSHDAWVKASTQEPIDPTK